MGPRTGKTMGSRTKKTSIVELILTHYPMSKKAQQVLEQSLRVIFGEFIPMETISSDEYDKTIAPVFIGKLLSELDKVSNIEPIDLPGTTQVFEMGKTHFGELLPEFAEEEAMSLVIDEVVKELKDKTNYLYTVVPRINKETKHLSILLRGYREKPKEEPNRKVLKRKLTIAQHRVFHRIYFNASDTPEEIEERVYNYLKEGFDKGVLKDYELFQGIDEETFRPYVLAVMKVGKI